MMGFEIMISVREWFSFMWAGMMEVVVLVKAKGSVCLVEKVWQLVAPIPNKVKAFYVMDILLFEGRRHLIFMFFVWGRQKINFTKYDISLGVIEPTKQLS